MTEKRFSEMTEHELRTAIADFNEKAKKAEQMGMSNEFAVYERKMLMAQAYMLDPIDYKPGEIYSVKGSTSSFKIDYLNGYFAWGYRDGAKSLEAVPISLLERK
ncbi:YfhH family protein [Halalkalibacter hemicellulosilyticus]|uniref:Transcription regulator CDS_ID OB0894 n=1 Tax=Halalkalibacter hemicellulosilyticusJCM 9152 TaxID=1236971 RepID=W4QGB6_9BACI|nr:YfhH family protein [Halalkalibacter hemicellulosilyticus]GAE31131.1 transcription regulator CDS_ID OB0894 [Halalkalibacter hemicellulosilyticusJCM 9152]